MAKVAVKRAVQYLVYDTFTGAGALADHAPDVAPVGAAWSVLAGTFSELSGGRLPYPVVSTYALAIIEAAAANGELEVTGVAGLNNAAFRSSADGTQYYYVLAQVAQNRVELRKHVDSIVNGTVLGNSGTGSTPLTAGADAVLSVFMQGYLCRILVNGSYVYDVWDEDYDSHTKHGVAGAWGGSWDTFVVRPAATWKQVLVFGDSISMMTDNHNAVFTTGTGVGSMWPARVAGGYNGSRAWAHSHAVGGASAGDGRPGYSQVAQVAAAVDHGHQPDLLFSMFGANENSVTTTVEDHQAGLEDMVLAWPGVPIYVLGVPPSTTTEYSDPANRAVLNAKIETAALAVGATFWDCGDWIDPATDTYDGLHPNAAGNIKIANEVISRL